MKLKRTSNIERPTSNIEVGIARKSVTSKLDVVRSTFDVRPNLIRLSRKAFSFAEVMFAVVILGIGFIMVAAVFPVAIRQTQSTGEENTAASAARSAAAAIAAAPQTQNYLLYNDAFAATYVEPATLPDPSEYKTIKTFSTFPPTVKNYTPGNVPNMASIPPSIVVPFVGARWDLIRANLISNADPRYSYVPFYRRDSNSSVAELIVVAVTNRNREGYQTIDTQNSLSNSNQYGATVTTYPQTIPAAAGGPTMIYPDVITVVPNGLPNTGLEGYTLSMLDNPGTSNPLIRTYMIGRPQSTAGQYELNAGDGLALTAGKSGWGTRLPVIDPQLSLAGPEPRMNGTNPLYTKLNLPTTLQPVVGYATLAATNAAPTGQITLYTDSQSNILGRSISAAVSGAFVIIADDFPFNATTPSNVNYSLPLNTATYHVGALNGRIFRLGQQVIPSPIVGGFGATFNLDPAYCMQPGGDSSVDNFPALPALGPLRAKVYIVGAGKDSTGTNIGAAQGMGVFATFFQVQ